MLPTKDHAFIRRWAEENDGVPAEVVRPQFDGEPSVLHFLFEESNAGTSELRPLSWEDFFARFDLLNLSLTFVPGTKRFDIVRVERPLPPKATN